MGRGGGQCQAGSPREGADRAGQPGQEGCEYPAAPHQPATLSTEAGLPQVRREPPQEQREAQCSAARTLHSATCWTGKGVQGGRTLGDRGGQRSEGLSAEGTMARAPGTLGCKVSPGRRRAGAELQAKCVGNTPTLSGRVRRSEGGVSRTVPAVQAAAGSRTHSRAKGQETRQEESAFRRTVVP